MWRERPAVTRRASRILTVGLSTCFVVGAALVRPALGAGDPDPVLQRIFRSIITQPRNEDLNFRYARRAEKIGQLRKALGAYERVLMNDPDNAEARAGIRRIKRELAPDYTNLTAIFGGGYQSNPRYFRNGVSADGDGVFDVRLRLRDGRRLGERRWRTEGDALANWHPNTGSLDYGYVGASTGPLIDLGGGWQVRAAPGVAYSWLDGKTLFTEGSLQFNFESDDSGAFRRVDLHIRYDHVGRGFSHRDAIVVDAAPRLVFPNLARSGDALIIRPSYRYDGGTGEGPDNSFIQGDIFPFRYHQIGSRADYYVPATENRKVYLGIGLTADYRFYQENIPGESKDRRDYFIRPGTRLIFRELFSPDHTLVIGYAFEHNLSNYGNANFDNHVVAVKSVWRF